MSNASLLVPLGQLLLLFHLLNISRTQKSSGRKAAILTNCSSSSTSYCVSFLPLKHQELIKTYGLSQHYQEFQFRKWNIDILNITFLFRWGTLPHIDTNPRCNTQRHTDCDPRARQTAFLHGFWLKLLMESTQPNMWGFLNFTEKTTYKWLSFMEIFGS